MMLWERLAPKRIYPAEKMAKMSATLFWIANSTQASAVMTSPARTADTNRPGSGNARACSPATLANTL